MIVLDLISDNPEHKFAPYQRMANAIINCTQKNDECAPEDLLALVALPTKRRFNLFWIWVRDRAQLNQGQPPPRC
jgi:hypothetical protein